MEPSAARPWPDNATDRSKRALILLEKVETDSENPGPSGSADFRPRPAPMRWFVSNDAIFMPTVAWHVRLAGGEGTAGERAGARKRAARIGCILCAVVAISAFIVDSIVA